MATHSSILAWRIPWTEEPGGLQSTRSQRVGHNWAANTVLFCELYINTAQLLMFHSNHLSRLCCILNIHNISSLSVHLSGTHTLSSLTFSVLDLDLSRKYIQKKYVFLISNANEFSYEFKLIYSHVVIVL